MKVHYKLTDTDKTACGRVSEKVENYDLFHFLNISLHEQCLTCKRVAEADFAEGVNSGLAEEYHKLRLTRREKRCHRPCCV